MTLIQKHKDKYIDEPLPQLLDVNEDDVYARHDKNIANNVSDFFVYGPRNKLCMNLTLYFHYVYQRTNPDLYGFFDFNIEHFCELFDWTDNLQRVVDNEEELYITDHRDAIYRSFDIDEEKDEDINNRMISNIERFAKTKIGDAFIRLTFQNIIYSHKSYYYEGESTKLYSGKSLTFLDEFLASYSHIKGSSFKLTVQYKPNQKSLLNNVKNFAKTNLALLGTFRKTDNLDFLHLYISYVLNKLKISEKFENMWSINRKSFARLLGLNPEREPKELNKAIRRKINKYKDLSPDPIKFTLPMTDYVVIIEFPELKPATKEQKKIAIQYAFKRYFEQEMYENYVKYHVNEEKNPKTFKQWIQDFTLDIEQKKFAYVAAQRVIYKRKISVNEISEAECARIGIIPALGEKKIYPEKILSN